MKTFVEWLGLVGIALAETLVASGGNPVFAAETIGHPLDPLTTTEYSAVVSALKLGKYIDDFSLYPSITLDEPKKNDVLKWKPGDRISRRAFVIVKNGHRIFEARVDLSRHKVLSWKEIKGVQPGILMTEEWTFAQRIVLANPNWRDAVRERGIDDFRDVICMPHTVGNYAIADEEGHRLVKVTCYQSRGTQIFWSKPIEGLIAIVDLDKGEVVKVIDNGIVPIPRASTTIEGDSMGPQLKQSSIAQSKRQNVQVIGQRVTWHRWRFHVRIDPRLGLIVSTVRYNDNDTIRSVMYQGSISELFVPYMDPDTGWYFKTYMDAGEFGIGKLTVPLQPGLDCPPNAVFFDAVFADDWAEPYTAERAGCLFERYAADIAWRYYDATTGQNIGRRRTELVLRFIAAVGNYHYIFDWIFREDGTIKVAVGATGTEQVKAVKSRTIVDDTHGFDTAFGHMVAENSLAINHDHFFCFRIDLDVDGPRNSFIYERLMTERLNTQSPRKSAWVVDAQTATTEQAARLQIDIKKPALWRAINPNVTGMLGYHVSYQLKPGTNAVSLLSPDDFPQRRAGFTNFHLWVTPYHRNERYAAGMYPNQSKGDDGLPRWTRANRTIENTDIVLWYTFGFHHVVRAEDWPVLSTSWNGFELRPFDFFQRNPALNPSKQ